MNMEKIEKVENLSFSELIDTIYNLANRLGYKNILKEQEILIAFNESPLSSDKYLFVFLKIN